MKLFYKFSGCSYDKLERWLKHEIVQWVYGRLKILSQFQKYELVKLESSETKLYVDPEVWTYVGENGEIMPTKRLYSSATYYSLDEHGQLQCHGMWEGAKWEHSDAVGRRFKEEQNAATGEPVVDTTGVSEV